MVLKAKAAKPEAEVLIHPECTLDVLKHADYVGSTSGIIDYATKSKSKDFLISTELGVLYMLKQKNPDKNFYSVGPVQICPNMKKVTLEKIRDCLRDNTGVVEVSDEIRIKSLEPLQRMLTLAK